MNMGVFVLVLVFVLGFLQIGAAAGRLDLWSGGRDELVKWGGYGEEKLSTVVISGRIVCSSINTPVSGARVAVICAGGRRLMSSSSSSWTDGSGKFVIDLPSHLHAIPNLDKACHVRIVQLPRRPVPKQQQIEMINKPIQIHLATSLNQGRLGLRTYTTHNIHLSFSKN